MVQKFVGVPRAGGRAGGRRLDESRATNEIASIRRANWRTKIGITDRRKGSKLSWGMSGTYRQSKCLSLEVLTHRS